MSGEQKLVVAGVALIAIGIGKASLQHKPIDKPIIGGLAAVLLLATLSLFGEDAADLAGNLALIAVLSALLIDGQPLLDALQKVTGTTPKPAPTIPGGAGTTPKK